MTKPRKVDDTPPELPKNVVVGDVVVLRDGVRNAYAAACLKAGWTGVDLRSPRTVERIDEFGGGGHIRLFVSGGPPYAYGAGDVKLAWEQQGIDRRKMLRKKGWKV